MIYADDLRISKEELSDCVQATQEPVLTTSQLERLLKKHQRFMPYGVSTLFRVNDRVVPTVKTGRVYRCFQGGTTDIVEPTWIIYGQRTYIGQRFQDGDPTLGVIWMDDGPDDASFFDVNGAAHDGWLLKASILQQQFNVSSAEQSFQLRQQFENAQSMASMFAPMFVI